VPVKREKIEVDVDFLILAFEWLYKFDSPLEVSLSDMEEYQGKRFAELYREFLKGKLENDKENPGLKSYLSS